MFGVPCVLTNCLSDALRVYSHNDLITINAYDTWEISIRSVLHNCSFQLYAHSVIRAPNWLKKVLK